MEVEIRKAGRDCKPAACNHTMEEKKVDLPLLRDVQRWWPESSMQSPIYQSGPNCLDSTQEDLGFSRTLGASSLRALAGEEKGGRD